VQLELGETIAPSRPAMNLLALESALTELLAVDDR
jgi:hypothetical protein